MRVVTLMYGSAWERYGNIFATTFHRYWPAEADLVVVADRDLPLKRGRVTALNDIPGVVEFRARWNGHPKAAGMGRLGVKVDEKGYSWRHDALKWMPQAMAPLAALDDMQDGEVLCWLDADVETTSAVPADWVEGLLGDCDVACLQRAGTHSEIGFYACRISPDTKAMLRHFAGLFADDTIFSLREQHSAFAFDVALNAAPWLKIRNLSPGKRGHVWPSTALADHAVHKKGKRKGRR